MSIPVWKGIHTTTCISLCVVSGLICPALRVGQLSQAIFWVSIALYAEVLLTNFLTFSAATMVHDTKTKFEKERWTTEPFYLSLAFCCAFDLICSFGHRCEMNACTKANLAINDLNISWMYFECWQMFIVCIGRLSFLRALTKTSKEVSNLHWSDASDLII
jgi:hypothetical protein